MKNLTNKTKHVYYNNIAPVCALPGFYIKRAYNKPDKRRKVYLWFKRKAKWFAIIAILSIAILAVCLNTKLTKSNTTVDELSAKNIHVSTLLDDCSYNKDALNAQLITKVAEIETIKADVNAKQAKIAELEARVAELSNTVSIKDAEINSLKVPSFGK